MTKENIIDILKSKQDCSHLSIIDEVILTFKNIKDTTFDKELLEVLAENIFKHKEIGLNNQNSINTLFDKSLARNTRDFISICLLRILNNRGNLPKIVEIEAFKLFDNVLSDSSIYKKRGINERTENYIKESNLKDYIIEIESNLSTLTLSTLRRIDDFNDKDFRNKINYKENKLIIYHYLPANYDSELNSIFSQITKYKSSDLFEKGDQIDSLKYNIESFLEKCTECSTFYSKEYLETPLRKIIELINNEFEQSPINKPAILNLSGINKKYPFGNLESEFNLSFFLQKSGEGYAYDTVVEILDSSCDLKIPKKKVNLGKVTESQKIDFPVKNTSIQKEILIELVVSWVNYDKTEDTNKCQIELLAQRNDIDWEKLKYETPFSTNAVEIESKLIGRKEIFNTLYANTNQSTLSSFYLFGQKRVGKSSIAKTLKSKINNLKKKDFIVIYLETGEFNSSNALSTINKLVERICIKVKSADKRLSDISIPSQNDSFSVINDFLDEVFDRFPDIKIMIILDEFDQINPDLYGKTEIGDSFFVSIRAISGKPNIGFLLVGGELMKYIISNQGMQINFFRSFTVDYFERDYLNDFKDLVRKPISDFEITDEAVNLLYEYTSGNPYFTVIICEYLFRYALDKRDNYITNTEMQEAINKAIRNEKSNAFAHFWDDGIPKTSTEREKISIDRRKFLLSIESLLKDGKTLTDNSVLDNAIKVIPDEQKIKSLLREFCERKVLLANDSKYFIKVKFFKEWLIVSGAEEIILTFSDEDRINEQNRIEKASIIHSNELLELVNKWKSYRGKQITIENVREWLEQFGENTKQRLVLRILQNIKYYDDFIINQKVEQLGREIKKDISKRNLERFVGQGKRKRDDILVSYHDKIGKSGASYAKKFADILEIYFEYVVEKDKITNVISLNKAIKSIVFIDDFVGTGNSVCEYFEELSREYPDLFEKNDTQIYLGIIVGFSSAKEKIEKHFADLGINVKVIFIDILGSSDMCFSSDSAIYQNITDREKAKSVCYGIGRKLEENCPLGFGDCQATVVFSDTCPNNSLPILWKKSKEWKPLFERVL